MFGTDSEEVLAALGARLGEPDLTVGPQRYVTSCRWGRLVRGRR